MNTWIERETKDILASDASVPFDEAKAIAREHYEQLQKVNSSYIFYTMFKNW